MGERVNEIFKPAWWCRGAHAQTLFGALLRPKQRLTLRRKRLGTPDGDFLDVDFLQAPSSNGKMASPLVVILHGLEGSSQAPYVRSLMGEVCERGWDAAAVNMRMCSGVPNRLKNTYHSGKSEDLEVVVEYLKEEERRPVLYVVGFSIGGNIVLKWLGEQGDEAARKIRKAAVVSVPYDLAKSVDLMDRGFNREVYTRSLLGRLKTKVFAKKKDFPSAVRYDLVSRCKTFKVFDREVTAPLNGFADEKVYWSETSCSGFLKAIQVETLLIHSEDDPFFPGRYLPIEDIRYSKHLHMLLLSEGGHLGFVSGMWPWKQDLWIEKKIIEFFDEYK